MKRPSPARAAGLSPPASRGGALTHPGHPCNIVSRGGSFPEPVCMVCRGWSLRVLNKFWEQLFTYLFLDDSVGFFPSWEIEESPNLEESVLSSLTQSSNLLESILVHGSESEENMETESEMKYLEGFSSIMESASSESQGSWARSCTAATVATVGIVRAHGVHTKYYRKHRRPRPKTQDPRTTKKSINNQLSVYLHEQPGVRQSGIFSESSLTPVEIDKIEFVNCHMQQQQQWGGWPLGASYTLLWTQPQARGLCCSRPVSFSVRVAAPVQIQKFFWGFRRNVFGSLLKVFLSIQDHRSQPQD